MKIWLIYVWEPVLRSRSFFDRLRSFFDRLHLQVLFFHRLRLRNTVENLSVPYYALKVKFDEDLLRETVNVPYM